MMLAEESAVKKRQEHLLFDVASFVLKRAKHYAINNFGRGIGATARTSGRSGALMRSIIMTRVHSTEWNVTAGNAGVPYAAIHELGTSGKGGTLPSIVPKSSKALTIPLLPEYVGHRAREFSDLHLLKPKDSKFAFLGNSSGKLAYLLLKRVDIKARPYLQPAVDDAKNEQEIIDRLKVLFGSAKLSYEVKRI